jgi:acyl dehydratase
MLFSNMTLNPQPLHIDRHFCAQTEWGQPIMNSLFTLGLMIGISVGETTLGTTVANLGMDEVRFPKPVFHGDTIRIESEVLELRESKSRPQNGIVIFAHRAFNQRDELVAVCKRSALMLRKPTREPQLHTAEQRGVAKRLIELGGSDPNAKAAPRKRPWK